MPKKPQPIQSVKGMHDILPDMQPYFNKIHKAVENIADAYNFSRIDLPIVEYEDLFVRGTGKYTDIVEKEMYVLKTKGGDKLALRPEFTPGLIRAYIEHGMSSLSQPVKLYTSGPLFRHENPQKGRYRQHHQFNFDILGGDDPALDAEVIYMFWLILKSLGIKDAMVNINSVGCKECRSAFRSSFLAYYRSRSKKLCKNCNIRLKLNPLRILDCKEEKCEQFKRNAPQIIDSLCQECNRHFKSVLEFLDEIDVPYFLDILLVRGLDYYTRTVFEFVPKEQNDESGAVLRQSSIGGGGRYDNLSAILGGKSTPAVGCGGGLERIAALMREQKIKMPAPKKASVFMVQLGELAKKKSFKLFEELRKSGISVSESFGKNSLKSQLKLADKAGALISLIFGQKEALDGNIIIRDMKSGVQEVVSLEKLVAQLKKRLKKK